MKLYVVALVAAAVALCAVPEPNKSKTAGFPAAPLRLELYGDFSCPHCRMVHEQFLPLLMKDYVIPGKAYLVFRDYVLNGPGHQYSHDAATYAAAAARIGRYQTAADALFKAQGAWLMNGQIWPSIYMNFTAAEQKQIQTLVKDPAVAADVKNDVDAGNLVPITQTPTLLVIAKGKRQPWTMWNNYPLLKSYLDSMVSAK